jgi:hypothetical protein
LNYWGVDPLQQAGSGGAWQTPLAPVAEASAGSPGGRGSCFLSPQHAAMHGPPHHHHGSPPARRITADSLSGVTAGRAWAGVGHWERAGEGGGHPGPGGYDHWDAPPSLPRGDRLQQVRRRAQLGGGCTDSGLLRAR